MSEIYQIKVGSDVYDFRDKSKAPLESPELTGTPTAPTAPAGTNSKQIATTEFVMNAFQANDSMLFKGTIGASGSGATVTSLPATHNSGWTYKVISAGMYAGQKCEVGDLIICVTDRATASDDDWTVIQANVDGVMTGPASSGNGNVPVFNGTSGDLLKDSGFSINKSVPADAKFTDTTYTAEKQDIGSASAGAAIAADEITEWDPGETPTLGDPIQATQIDSWTPGTTPTLGANIPADDITKWTPGSLPSVSVVDGVLMFNPGTLPDLQYSEKSIPNVTNVGTVAKLTKTDKSIPNVTDVGTAPSLTHVEKSIPNISVTSKKVVTEISAT